MEYSKYGRVLFLISLPNGQKPDTTVPLQTLLDNAGFKSQNVGRAQIKGWEISINGSGKIGPINVSLFTGYTFIDPINRDYNPTVDTFSLPI